MRRLMSLAACALALVACAGTGSNQTHRYFVLEAPSEPAVTTAAPVDTTLVVAPTIAAPFYDTQEMAFSRSLGTRAYYRFSSWTEPPAQTMAPLLVSRLEQAHAFRAAIPATSGIKGSLLLRTRLDEFYHDAVTPPGVARVTVTAEVIDPAQGTLLGRKTFAASANSPSYDADGAVQGFRQAVTAVLDDIAGWVVEVSVARRVAPR